MVRFRELYGTMPGILVPGVLLDYSGKRVITSEWIDGEKVRDPRTVELEIRLGHRFLQRWR